MPSSRAPRNRTLALSPRQLRVLSRRLLHPDAPLSPEQLDGGILNGDLLQLLPFLPDSFVDLLILDPPYSLDKNFHGLKFHSMDHDAYLAYLESWFPLLLRLLKPQASVYLCGDWHCSAADFLLLSRYLHVRNRITWQREKGRASASNWKNCSEDIWFATRSSSYYFDPASVRLKRKVIAPYRSSRGVPRDWSENDADGKFRLTAPANLWDDISVPFWSMPENTDHPTQKPEKLLAKLILASSRPGDFVFDPFLGSGTTAVAARKLGRRFAGIELNPEYCCWALARLDRAASEPSIQGFENGVFLQRNFYN